LTEATFFGLYLPPQGIELAENIRGNITFGIEIAGSEEFDEVAGFTAFCIF
jgi:hypothetical protein